MNDLIALKLKEVANTLNKKLSNNWVFNEFKLIKTNHYTQYCLSDNNLKFIFFRSNGGIFEIYGAYKGYRTQTFYTDSINCNIEKKSSSLIVSDIINRLFKKFDFEKLLFEALELEKKTESKKQKKEILTNCIKKYGEIYDFSSGHEFDSMVKVKNINIHYNETYDQNYRIDATLNPDLFLKVIAFINENQ